MAGKYEEPIGAGVADPLKGIKTNFPDQSFDPLAASDEDLARHFLPPRPDSQQAPTAYANWERAMASRPRFPPNTLSSLLFGKDIQIVTYANRTLTQGSSQNWSGGFVRPQNFDAMVLVQGRWIVPDTPVPKEGEVFASSVWIGFDGHDPASRIIPQIGTGQIGLYFPKLSPLPFDIQVVWWQLWLRENPTLWQVQIPIPVSRNDRFYGQVQAVDDVTISFYLKNETENVAYAAYYCMEGVDTASDLKPFELRTAEWIVERPRIPDPAGADVAFVPDFADYGETAFTDCNAVTEAADGTWQEVPLQRA